MFKDKIIWSDDASRHLAHRRINRLEFRKKNLNPRLTHSIDLLAKINNIMMQAVVLDQTIKSFDELTLKTVPIPQPKSL